MEWIVQVKTLQSQWVEEWHKKEPTEFLEGFLGVMEKQHLQNFLLWHEEDIARDVSVSDQEISRVKRSIDQYNQKRNDYIEKLDEFLLSWLVNEKIEINPEAPLNSETPGSMIDRCSIMALKIYHMEEEANRESADQAHRHKAGEKVKILKEQREDLFSCLIQLLEEAKKGTRQFKIYRQFKMYNDPTLNPRLYSQQ